MASLTRVVSVTPRVMRERAALGSCRRHELQPFNLGLLRALSPRRPFPDHAQRSLEALSLRPAPELGRVAAASIPLGIEPGQIGVERALSDPEDVSALSA